MNTIEEKYEKLLALFRSYSGAAVAFSGGVDSTLLLRAAHDALGDRALAVTAVSEFFPERERGEAAQFCRDNGIPYREFHFEALAVEGVRGNPPDRCYRCKRALFETIAGIADERGLAVVAEGTNLGDQSDYRPGMRAVRELGVVSPLCEAGLSKAEIRALSRRLGLPGWDKPSFACLASRLAYGETITLEKLRRVEQAEDLLLAHGFRQLRVRVHGELARIEVPPEEIGRLAADGLRQQVCGALRDLGFRYVTLDLGGYRTGSMNEALARREDTP